MNVEGFLFNGWLRRLTGPAVPQESPEAARGRENAARGRWGEDTAAAYLKRQGYRIVERNARPCAADRRCEIDIIACERETGAMVFVEVKTHKSHSPYARRMWAFDRRKRRPVYRACVNWLMRNHWHGDFRFDLVEVYGSPGNGAAPEIDHIRNVRMFPDRWRFWR